MSPPAAPETLTVTVRIMSNEYAVACPPEEHEALVASAEFLNRRMLSIRRRGKALGAERIAVMAALNIARELLDLRGETEVGGTLDPDHDSPVRVRLMQLGLDIESALSSSD